MIEITKFKPMTKNTLRGFLDVKLTAIGLEIRDICLHEKDGSRWVQLPSKPYQDKEGKQSYAFILNFYDKAKKQGFQDQTLKALDQYRGAQHA